MFCKRLNGKCQVGYLRSAPLRLIALAVLGCVLCGSCDSKSPPDAVDSSERASSAPRLVVLIATCSVNRNYLSPYNSAVRYTPHFEQFAAESVVFTRHVTEAGQSGTTFASIFTGVQADKHGIYRQPAMLADDLYLIGEAYSENGYETFYWNAHAMASKKLNYGQGISWDNTYQKEALHGRSPKFSVLLEKVRSDPSYRAFVLTTFTDTHGPYNDKVLTYFRRVFPELAKRVPVEDLKRYLPVYYQYRKGLQRNFPETVAKLGLSDDDVLRLARVVNHLYKSRVWVLDVRIGTILAAIQEHGLREESLIVFTSDHGEILYRENALFKWSHGGALTPEVLTVPFIVYVPRDSVAPGRYEKVTRSIDVFPTMAGLSGFSLPPDIDIDGVDLSPALRGEAAAPQLRAYSHTCVLNQLKLEAIKKLTLAYRFQPVVDVNLIWVSFREGDMHYKLRPTLSLDWVLQAFDLSADPTETTNLFDPQDATHRRLAEDLRAYKQLLVDSYNHYIHYKANELLPPQDEQIEALKSLGYID